MEEGFLIWQALMYLVYVSTILTVINKAIAKNKQQITYNYI